MHIGIKNNTNYMLFAICFIHLKLPSFNDHYNINKKDIFNEREAEKTFHSV
jgi:hypothetical protein